MKASVDLYWIKGHQDKDKPYNQLPDDAQINIDMDNESNTAKSNNEQVKTTPLPGSGAMLIIKGEMITTRYKEAIHEAIMRPKHKQYFLEKYNK